MTRRVHRCHAIGCSAPCPPKHLMCAACWALVSPETQAEVYRTVKLRDMRSVDATWAPWWRASHRAMFEAAVAAGLDGHVREDRPPWSAQRWLDQELAWADGLEKGG